MGKMKKWGRLIALNLAFVIMFSSVAFAGISGIEFPFSISFATTTMTLTQNFYVDEEGMFTFRVSSVTGRVGYDWFRVHDSGNNPVTPLSVTLVEETSWRHHHYFVFSLRTGQHTLIYDGGGVSTGANLRMFQGTETPQGFSVHTTTQGQGNVRSNVDWRTGAWPGETVRLYASPSVIDGYVFSYWEVDYGNVTISDTTSSNATFIMPSNDVEVRAVFVRDFDAPTVTVISNNPAWGWANAGAWGDTVELWASPEAGHVFVGWREITGYGVTFTPSLWRPNDVSFPWPPPGNVIVEAEFRPMVGARTVTVTVNNTDWGNEWWTSAFPSLQEPGQTVNLEAQPRMDWIDGQTVFFGEFLHWEVIAPAGLDIADPTSSYTSFIMPDSDVSVHAVFREAVAVTDVSIAGGDFELVVGESQALTAILTPADATNQWITWTSSNTTVATTNRAGLITAVSPGTAVITATTEDGGHTATVEVTVRSHFNVPATGISNITAMMVAMFSMLAISSGLWGVIIRRKLRKNNA